MADVPVVDVSVFIAAPPIRVMKAFFDPQALTAWWQVAHAVTTPRALGPYAVEWEPTDFRDPILGRLGGVLRGTVMYVHPTEGFFVADAFWLPPDGEPIGPMALHVSLRAEASGTQLHLLQTGFEEGDRWRRFYEVFGAGIARALVLMKNLLEK
jgi:uncharacterized protein YndB with AHSA1/START domain